MSITRGTGRRCVEPEAEQTCFIHRLPGTQPGVPRCYTQLETLRLQPAASSRFITHNLFLSSSQQPSSRAQGPQPHVSAALYNTAHGLNDVSASAPGLCFSPVSVPLNGRTLLYPIETKVAHCQGAYIRVFTLTC